MLRVTLEIVPFGQEDRKRTIGTMTIANVGGNGEYGDYVADTETPEWRAVTGIKKFSRKKGAWALVLSALRKTKIPELDIQR